MQESKDDTFTSEFRHDTVVKFIKDLLDGSAKLSRIPDLESETGKFAVQTYANLCTNIEKYGSGKFSGDELVKIESEIFYHLVTARMSGTITNEYNISKFEQDVNLLHMKIDSTNELLQTIVLILDKAVKGSDR